MPALTELQQVLLGCHDDACLARARAVGKQVLLDEKPTKALKQAGSLAENLMLAYVQGMPRAQVGWGRLDAAGIGRLVTLHNASFAYAKQWPLAARGRGGNMLVHIGATLDAAAGEAGTVPSLAHAGERVVILLGHDTDLASQAGLLGLDWHNTVQSDDYPPGGALIYRLVESNGHYAVRLRVALPTLKALRDGDVDAPHAMHVAPVRISGCGDGWSCPLASFRKIVAKAVQPADVVPGTGDEPAAH
jgi:4-phytase/acid phosphatase